MNFIFLFIISILINSSALHSSDLISYDYELDVYYSNISAFIDLDRDSEVTDATEYSETEIYTKLLGNSFHPNVFLIEAAIHPMSLFGLAFRKHNEDLYDKATIENFNMVKALTAGFEELYSVSFFIGRMVVFNKKNRDHIGKNRAYTGLLVSVGDRSIKDNQTHDDKWVNLEFKLKGTREKKNRDLDWSFRVGGKLHNNRDFVDTLYVGVRRSSTDYKKSIWSMINNSAFMTMVEVSSETFHLTGFESTVEKKFPLNGNDKIAFGLELGYLFNSGDRYRGELKEEGVNKHQLYFVQT